MSLWTCITTCSVCGRELKRTQDVPDERRSKVIMKAPFVSICPVAEHNTFADFNLRLKLKWIEQERQPAHLLQKHKAKPAPHPRKRHLKRSRRQTQTA